MDIGSGKSHLVKMLRALWINTEFSDGVTAHSIASLPQNIVELLKALMIQAKRHGGLHAASMQHPARLEPEPVAVFGWLCCESYLNRQAYQNTTRWPAL